MIFVGIASADEDKGPVAAHLLCQTSKGEDKDKKEEWKREPKAESSVTQHHLSAGGKCFDYTATAGDARHPR